MMVYKNLTFAIGLAWLLYGATQFDVPDWDIGVSLVMAFSTYLSAEWVANSIFELNWRRWPIAIAATWWSVDGSYWLYWSLVNPHAMIRDIQWPASLCLFLLCGFIWRLLRQLPRLRLDSPSRR